MSEIQRYVASAQMHPSDDDDSDATFVLYADHVKAMDAQYERGFDNGLRQGQRDERLAAFKRLMSIPATQCHPDNPNIKMIEQEEAACAVVDMLPCGTPGYRHPYDVYEEVRRDALAGAVQRVEHEYNMMEKTAPSWVIAAIKGDSHG